MILVDNRNVLRVKDRDLLNRMAEVENSNPTGNVIVEQAKSGDLTLKIVIDGKKQYVHSKYDPVKEAERFISKFKDEAFKHVLIVGAGLGYHIQAFTEAHPDTKFSIYEPNMEVLLAYLSHAKLKILPLQNLSRIFTGTDSDKLKNEIQQLIKSSNGMLKIVTLPVYEKVYGGQIIAITNQIIESLKDKRLALLVNSSFQKRWTVNSIKNFPTILKTPNILHDINKIFFRDKPAIIVAAGPSLNEEIENLRYIKENGLAYIFSVGSAINALVEHGIYPDAACTYDPTERNQFVIQKIKDEQITDIPLIFGSSVGFETLEEYPGKMLHMITSQDTVSPCLLDTTQSIDIVLDAPTIAVITLQLLTRLGCNPIMLVGQNLGYQDNKRYASGIKYESQENELNEAEKKASLTVKDVYGNDIQTSDGFNRMRQQLEKHIGANPQINVINTTRGGAQIEGTSFVHLDDLIHKNLKSDIVEKGWTEESNAYNTEYTKTQLEKLSHAEKDCKKTLQNALDELKRIHEAVEKRQTKNMENRFVSFDKEFGKLKRNSFYKGFVEPMVIVQNNRLSEKSQSVRYETDVMKKAEVVIDSFYAFIQEVYLHVEFALPYFVEMKERIEEMKIEIEQEN